MAVVDLDPAFAKAIDSLHSTSSDSLSSLQTAVEEAIKAKSGNTKDLSSFLNRSYNTLEELSLVSSAFLDDVNKRSSAATSPIVSAVIDDSKTNSSSDNELEMDLLKEDLMCIVCNEMDVGARNRLLECSECHSLYHQECHRPPVTEGYAEGTWVCLRCKESSKASKKAVSVLKSSHSKSSSSSSRSSPTFFSSAKVGGSSSSKGASPVHSSSSASGSGGKGSSGSGSSSKQSGQGSGSSGSGSSRQVTPNINIISADKRLQIMKKKAAKQQEKRKLHR